jgi:hypothetical protein
MYIDDKHYNLQGYRQCLCKVLREGSYDSGMDILIVLNNSYTISAHSHLMSQ